MTNKPVKPRQAPSEDRYFLMFWEAQSHGYSARELLRGRTPLNTASLSLSATLLESFSLEVFLKCLLAVEGGVGARGHDLRKLFDMTTPASQAFIRERAETYILPERPRILQMLTAMGVTPLPRVDMDFLLDAGARAFDTDFRYLYDIKGQDTPQDEAGAFWDAGMLLDCVRERILRLRPDFIELMRTMRPVARWEVEQKSRQV